MHMVDDRKYTVYCHESPHGKRYVGITCTDVKKRWRDGKGYSTNDHFYRAIQKYGWDNFEHYILFEGLSQEQAEDKEKELIALWDTMNPKHGYNRTSGGNANKEVSDETRAKLSAYFKEYFKTHKPPSLGRAMSEESKKKLSDARKGSIWSEERKQAYSKIKKELHYHHSEETKKKISESHKNRDNKRCKKVGQYDLEGNLIQIYPSIREAERQTGLDRCGISFCCNGKFKTSNGYIWNFIEDDRAAI